jgi:predicted PurR-regulated permease PerM
MDDSVHEKHPGTVPDLGPPNRVRASVVLGLTIVVLIVCYLLTVPFVPALTWALALAIVFAPSHRWLEGRLRSPSVAAFSSVFWIGSIVVVPAIWLGSLLATEAAMGAAAIKDKAGSDEWRQAFQATPGLALLLPWIDRFDLPGSVGNAASWIASTSTSLVRGGALQFITLLLTFYFLFFFLRDRKLFLDFLQHVSPLSAADTRRLFQRWVDTVYATLYGTIAVAAIQGALGGLIFWWLEIPAPLVWGLVMALLAIVPVLGAFVVWVPAAFFFVLEGNWLSALILAVWGTLVIGAIDNLLYPMLVGERLKLHTVPLFISIVGGLILFGSSGILLGPLTVATIIVLLEVWRIPVTNSRPREESRNRPPA